MKKNHLITVVGGIPMPIGGVTSFIERLVTVHLSKFERVLDLYPSDNKGSVEIRHSVVPRGSLFYLFLLFFCSVRSCVYFNFSGARGLVVIALLPKIGGRRWAVTLHNGDLAASVPPTWVMRWLIRRGLAKCDLVGVLSAKQRAFFDGLGAPSEKIYSISSFVPTDWSMVGPPNPSDIPEFASWSAGGEKVFIVSGYPTRIYQHDAVFRVFNKLWCSGEHSIKLVAFLYGQDTDRLLPELQKSYGCAPFAHLYWNKGADIFLTALKASAGYIRMNTVDSFGVAVAEAVSLGRPVLASNVCERFEGAQLADPDDWGGVENFVRRVVAEDVLKAAQPDQRLGALEDFLEAILQEGH